jgi:hypothetical protein
MNLGLKSILVGLLAGSWLFCSYSNAQDTQTTPNLVNPIGWQGCLTQHPGFIWAGTSGGPCPVQRAGDGAILFSYGQSTLTQTIAVNRALEGTGIVVRGYEYAWTIKNANAGANQTPSYDPLTISVNLTSSANQILESKTYDYNRRLDNWTTFAGTEDFANRYSLASLGNLSINLTGRDAGHWAGYYGPEINNISLRLRYGTDLCAANPLSSPDCPGYLEAYKAQQCAANPLFDPSCPGYQQAYFTQQCTANPLYNPSCPGYQQAYFTQQCTASALYNPQCPGYAEAYFTQQCTLNALYNTQCPGYQQAYFTQQCTLNQLYSTQCPLYEQAWFAKQCELNPLHSPQCQGYQQAFFTQQCNLNTLYNPQCPGYQVAYQEKIKADACRANPQSSPSCAGYIHATTSIVSIINQPQTQDVIKEITEIPLTKDPIVNQVLAPPREPNPSSQQQALGTGLVVPGVRIQPQQPSTRSSTQSRAVAAARSTTQAAEAQAQANISAQVAELGTTPGFDAYESVRLIDAQFYKPQAIYPGQRVIDNQRAQRALSQRSDRLYREMVDEQYR